MTAFLGLSQLWRSRSPQPDSASQLRSNRIRLAISTSVISKGVTVLVQLIAFPLAVHALGTERFGVYVLVTTGLAWLSVVYSGLGPGLARGIALSAAKPDPTEEARYFSAAIVLTSLFVLGLVASVAVYGAFRPLTGILLGGKSLLYAQEVRSALPLVLGIVGIQLLGGVADSSRAGYQEQFVTNTWGIVGNLMSLAALVWAVRYWPTVTGMVAAVYGVAALVRMGNVTSLLVRRPYLVPRPRLLTSRHLAAVLHTGAAFMVLQLGVFLNQQVSLLVVGRMKGPVLVGVFAVQFRLFAVLGGMIQMIIQPFWPAVIDAHARDDRAWIASAYRSLVRYSVAYAAVCAVVIALFGGLLVRHWVGRELVADRSTQGLMGLYFLLCIWPQPHAALLIGLGRYWFPAIVSLAENLLMIGLATLLIPAGGAMGLALAFCLANLLTSAWAIPAFARTTLLGNRPRLS